MDEALKDKITRAAKLAAIDDHKHGDHHSAVQSMTLIAWAAKMRVAHNDCGRLSTRVEDGILLGLDCPVHGFIEAPEWKERGE